MCCMQQGCVYVCVWKSLCIRFQEIKLSKHTFQTFNDEEMDASLSIKVACCCAYTSSALFIRELPDPGAVLVAGAGFSVLSLSMDLATLSLSGSSPFVASMQLSLMSQTRQYREGTEKVCKSWIFWDLFCFLTTRLDDVWVPSSKFLLNTP